MNKKIFIVAVPDEVEIQGEILNYPVIFSGIGKINATIAAMTAFNLGYNEIINIGSCGSLHLSVGDIVKVGIVYQDIDATPLSPYGITPFEANSLQVVLDVKSSTTCFTTDYFYDNPQQLKYSKYYLEMIEKCSIFDMECFSIAKVCKRFGIKFSSYKWVSDNGEHSDWKENCKIGFEKIKVILNEQFEKERISKL
jgi:adenosylhomocysteine nucleosidase